jgi:WD40 repeat protein
VKAATLSANGKIVATCCSGTEDVLLWDAQTGTSLGRLDGHSLAIDFLVCSSRDPRLLATCGRDRTLRIWDVGDRKQLRCLKAEQFWGTPITFSPDGTILAGSDGHDIVLSEVDTGRILHRCVGHTAHVRAVWFTPDGKTLRSWSDDQTIRSWSLASGRELAQTLHSAKDVFQVVPAPDGKVAVWWSHRSLSFRAVDLTTGNEIAGPKSVGTALATAAFSPDGRYLATSSVIDTRLWDIRTWAEIPKARKDVWAAALVFSRDGERLGAGGGDHRFTWWETMSNREVAPSGSGHKSGVLAVAVSPDGKSVATAGEDHSIRIWERATGKEIHELLEASQLTPAISFSPDGKVLLAGTVNRDVRLWCPGQVKEVGVLNRDFSPAIRHVVDWLAYAADGKILALQVGTVTSVLDAATGRVLHQIEPCIRCRPAISADGTTVVTARPEPEEIVVTDVIRKGERVRISAEPIGWTRQLALSPDGRVLAGMTDVGSVALWDATTGRLLRQLEEDAALGGINALAFSPDGKTVAAGCSHGTIQVWEVISGKRRSRFVGHRGAVVSLAFAPDGTALVSGGNDTTVLLWEVEGTRQSKPLPLPLSDERFGLLWKDLTGPNSIRAARAITLLAAATDQTPALVSRHFLASFEVDKVRLARLVAALDSEDFPTRERARQELETLGDLAERTLRRTLATTPSSEVKRQCEAILAKLALGEATPQRIWWVRAVELLERVGTPECGTLLERIAADAPAEWLKHEALTARHRLLKGHLPSR